MKIEVGEYYISDERDLLQLDRIDAMLKTTYWANNRNKETTEKAVSNSVCVGVYLGSDQVGFARLVTDWATMYYISDVVIDEKHRGKGLGKAMISFMCSQESMKGLSAILITRDAQEFYKQLGFDLWPSTFMRRPPDTAAQ